MASLIALCASHINGRKRLSMFRNMLKSIDCQHFQAPLFVSVSTENDTMKNELLRIAKEYPNFAFFIQDEKFTQFQHYAFLAQALSYDPQKTWCMFTDDDDISNVNRTEVFMKHINSVADDIIEVVRDTAVRTRYTDHLTEKDVNDESDDVIVQDFVKATNEYIVNACKLYVIQEFCRKAAKSTLLTMTGCDMIFGAWITTSRKTKTFHHDTWLYEYTIRPKTSRYIASGEGTLLGKVDFSVFD